MTFKACTPLTDTMAAGYILELPATINISNNASSDSLTYVDWRTTFPILDSQDPDVLGEYPIPIGYNKNIFRWIIDWKIETPPGYSLWITHPSHRHDLPFFTLNGFVDTDKHPNTLLLPFFIQMGFEGLIEKGTPIAQIIPIKRESWQSVAGDIIEKEEIRGNRIKLNFERGYKINYWSKKEYR
jgi:hypothetical protein